MTERSTRTTFLGPGIVLALVVFCLVVPPLSSGLVGIERVPARPAGFSAPSSPPRAQTSHAMAAPARRLPDAPYPGVYAFNDKVHLDPTVYPVYGGHKLFQWYAVEPWADDEYRWGVIEDWIVADNALGKPVGIGINSYDGTGAGGDLTPPWVYEAAPDAELLCHQEWPIPKYWHPAWLAAWADLIRDFGARYDGDPRLAWVVISTGMYGENWPASDYWHGDCLEEAGLTSELWLETMKRIVDIYAAAFPHTTLLLQFAPYYKSPIERREITAYAAGKGIGLKHNGLWPDTNGAVVDDPSKSYYQAGQYDPFFLWGDQVPTGWEGQEYQLTGDVGTLWGIYNGLNKHPDYLLLGEEITTNPSRRPMIEFAQTYLGRTIEDTPAVWVALREHDPNWQGQAEWFPQRGNYDFWLYQLDDAPGGRTVPEWGVSAYPEGRWTRRTDQSRGQRYMVFDVDDAYFYDGGDGSGARVNVTYYDQGWGSWRLQYDAFDDPYRTAGVVQKTNSGRWLTASFTLADARFADRQAGGGDFRLDCLGDGDEYFHFVQVIKLPERPAPPPEAVPTGSPPGLPPTLTPTPPAESVTLQQGVAGYTGTADVTISRWSPGTPNPNDALLRLRSSRDDPFTTIYDVYSILIRFDLSHLPSGMVVQDARLRLYAVDRTLEDRLRISAYELLRPWNEAQATWNQPLAGQWWVEPGANGEGSDRAARRTDIELLYELNLWYEFELTPLVQRWLDDPGSNYGVLLRDINVKNLSYSLASSEYPQVPFRPQLVIVYTRPGWTTPTPTPTETPTPTISPTPTTTPSPPPTTGHVYGLVFDDLDENGWHGEGEPPVAGAVVELLRGTTVVRSQTTLADGWYDFTAIEPGTYLLRETDPPGYGSITPNELPFQVAAGTELRWDFADRRLMPTATPTATPTPTPTPTATPTDTPTPTATATPTSTPTPTATPTATSTPTATPTATSTPTATCTPTATATATPTATAIATPTPTPTPTATPTATSTPTATCTPTPTATATPTSTPTPTATPTATST
ncbi:MAG: DNRLRE domain-containing protein, partial [Anaerolineae bacterium]|nr:DNRLRE domain-containing protein [Anaerolineae bacterium]